MPQITAWKCPKTSKIFEYETDYKKHLRRLAADSRETKRRQTIIDNIYGWIANEKENIYSVGEIAPWLLKNQKYLMEAANALHLYSFNDKFYDTDEFTKIELVVKWSNDVSNSHNCPKGGVTNWGVRDKTLPTGYPGWTGKVSGCLKRLSKHKGSYPYDGILKLVGIHTTSGGGGNESWGFGTELFLADWPGLEQQRMVDILAGKIQK